MLISDICFIKKSRTLIFKSKKQSTHQTLFCKLLFSCIHLKAFLIVKDRRLIGSLLDARFEEGWVIMKKIFYLIICAVLTIGNGLSVSNLWAKRAGKKHKKAKVQPTLGTSSLLNPANSFDNGVMTDLLQAAQVKAKELEEEVSERTKLLHQKAEERYQQMQEEVAQRTKEIQELAKRQSEELTNKFKEQAQQVQVEVQQTSTALRHQAAQQVVSLLNQAEEEAIKRKRQEEEEAIRRKREAEEEELARRREERAQALTNKLEQSFEKPLLSNSTLFGTASLSPLGASLTRVEKAWKDKTSQEFHNNMSLMKQIILEGESDTEAQDFMKRFARQSRWFDATISNTTYVCDEHYKEIVKRATRLRNVVQTQKSADRFLDNLAAEKNLTLDEIKKVRLAVLYELNAQLSRAVANNGNTTPNDSELRKIVLQAMKETIGDPEERPPQLIAIKRTPQHQASDSSQVIPLAVSSNIQSDLETLTQEIKDLKDTLTREIRKRKRTKKKLKDKDSKIIELEQRLMQAQASVTKYKDTMPDPEHKLALEVQHTAQSEAAAQEQKETINNLQKELDRAKQDIDQLAGKASANLSEIKQEMESLSEAETELRKKFAQSLEQEKQTNLELERKAREALEENAAFQKKLTHAQEEKVTAVTEIKQEVKGKLEDVSKQLLNSQVDTLQATEKASKLEGKVKESEGKILQLTQEKVQLIQAKEQEVKQIEDKLTRKFKGKIEDTQVQNLNLQVEQRKAEQAIAHLKDKVLDTEQEKNKAITQTQKQLQDQFNKTLDQKERAHASTQQNLKSQIQQAQQELQTQHERALQEQNAAIKQTKTAIISEFKPKLEEKEKINLELEVSTRKALEEASELKTRLISSLEEKEQAVAQTESKLKEEFKPKFEQARQEQLQAELESSSIKEKNRGLKNQVEQLENKYKDTVKENKQAIAQTESRLKKEFKPKLEQARYEQLQAELKYSSAEEKARSLETKYEEAVNKQAAIKSTAKSLIENANKEILESSIQKNRLQEKINATAQDSPIDDIALMNETLLPTLEMLDQDLGGI